MSHESLHSGSHRPSASDIPRPEGMQAPDYRRLFDSIPTAALLLTASGEIIAATDVLLALICGKREQLVGRSLWSDCSTTLGYSEQVLGELRESLETSVRQKAISRTRVHRWSPGRRRNDEVERYWQVVHAPILDGENRDLAYIFHGNEEVTELVRVSHALTQHQRDREALQQRLQQLERSNADLEAFAATISHDLGEPLRMVTHFLSLLELRHGSKLTRDAREYLQFAANGAARMRALIQGLFEYGKADKQPLSLELIAIEAAVSAALENLTKVIQESGAVISYHSLPSIHGDLPQLTQLFQNLIENAIKYRRSTPPRILIGARLEKKDWVFSIEDNGIGIESQYTEKIFRSFHRLHDAGAYPGSGLGLAICRRIVERHGGRIWVTSTPGQGSVFFFTIPQNDAPERAA